MYTLLRPSNTKLILLCLSDLNPTEIEQFNIFIHYLILKNFHITKSINAVGVEILSKKLTSQIFNKKTFRKIIEVSLKHDAIIVDNSYQVGKKAKTYRINYLGNFTINAYQFEFKYSTNQCKFETLFASKNNVYSEVFQVNNDIIQRAFISRLGLDINQFLISIQELIQEKKAINELDIYYLNYLTIVEAECYSFSFLNAFSFYDDFSVRYYNFFTNKKSLIRQCFNLNGKLLSSLDVKSSQVYFLTQLPNLDLSQFEVDKSLIQIDNSFKKIVLNGSVYEFFAEQLNIDRTNAKKKLLSFLYGDKRLTNIHKIFEEKFPMTSKTLKYLMNLKVNNSKFCFVKKVKWGEVKKNNYLSYILQSVERGMFLSALQGLNDYYTVHDCVYFEIGREEEFKSQILNYFILNGLDLPILSST